MSGGRLDNIQSISLRDVKRDIYAGIVQCTSRGLIHSAKWLAELNRGLDTGGNKRILPELTEAELNPPVTGISIAEYDAYYLAKSFFDCREYDRCAHFTETCVSPLPRFLHLYATYMAKEKRRLDSVTDNTNLKQSGQYKDQAELLTNLKNLHSKRNMDGYTLYLYGVLLKRMDLAEMAIHAFLESVQAAPTLWSSWMEMALLVTEHEKLSYLNLPNHWMRHIFLAHCLVEVHHNDEGLKMFEDLQAIGFKNCVFITSQMAIAHHNKRSEYQIYSAFIARIVMHFSCLQMSTKQLPSSRTFKKSIHTDWTTSMSFRICCS